MVVPSRKSRDRRRKKERDNTRDSDSEEETCTFEEVMNREMASHDSGFCTSGIGSAPGARKKEIVEEKKKPSTRKKLVTEELSEVKSSTHDYQYGDPLSWHSWPSASSVSGTQGDRIVNGMRDSSTRPSTSGVRTSTPRGTTNDMRKMASKDSQLEKGLSGLGARKKEKVEKKEQTHRHEQNSYRDVSIRPSTSGVGGTPGNKTVNGMRDPSTRPSTIGVSTSTPRGTTNDLTYRDVSIRPSTSGVGGTPGNRTVNGTSSISTLSDHISTIIKSECLTAMKDVLTSALEKVEDLESKATKRTIECEQIPAETPKKKRELSPASSVEAPILVTTVQRSGSAVGQYPAVPRPGTSGNHHPVDGNMFVQTEQSVHVLRQYSSIIPVENCVFFEPVHIPEGSRSVTSVTSSQWGQQWMTIENDHHSVVSGVSSHWRQHRTTDDDNDSDNSGTKSPQSEKKSFFKRQELSNEDEEQPEDADLEDLSYNLLECSINGRSPRNTRKGSKSSEAYEISSVKINLMSTSSYVGSSSDQRGHDHAVSSPSRSQPPPNANQRPIIRQPRLSLPTTPPQTVYDAAGARNCRCPRCGVVWTSELALEEHYFEHLLGHRSCDVGGCEYTCSSRDELRRHIRAAHMRKHTCRRCGKAYLMASSLERHLRQCLPSACVDDASLCDHVANTHGAGQIACNPRPELRYYVCRECRFATISRTVALDHCQRHILGEINLNITLCEICDLLFVTGDLHFLMHAVDDSLNRKSFQVVDFDWRVSLNARRQLESNLKKNQTTKAIKSSIDEETSTATSNVEETTTETNDVVARGTVSKNHSPNTTKQEDVLEASMNEPVQSETWVERRLEEQTSVVMSQSNDNVSTSSTVEVQNQNAALYEATSTAITNFKESNVEIHDINAPPSIIPLESQVIINGNEAHVDWVEENTLLQEHNKKQDHTKELNKPNSSKLGENLDKPTDFIYKNLAKCGTDFKSQSSNTTQQKDVLEANTIKEPVQTEPLVEKPLAPQTLVEMSPSNSNVDNNNQSLPSSSTAEVQNQYVALDKETIASRTNVEDLNVEANDIHDEASGYWEEQNTWLNQTKSRINQSMELMQEINKIIQQRRNTKKNPFQSEMLVEIPVAQETMVKSSELKNNVNNGQSSDIPFSSTEDVLNQNAALDEESTAGSNFEDSNVETTDIMSSPNEVNLESYVMLNDKEARNNSMEENTSLQENNKNTSLDSINDLNEPNSSQLRGNLNLAHYGTASKNQLSNTTQQVNEANMVKDSELSETLDERPLEQQTTVDMSQSNVYVANNKSLPCPSAAKVQNQNAALDEGTSNARSKFEDSNVETTDIMSSPNEVNLESYVMLNDKEARNNSMEENTSLQENNKNTSLDSINDLNEPNSSQLRGNLNLARDSKNQLSNTTQQVDEANMVKDSELSETLDERPLEQQTTVDMSQSNVYVANNKSLPCSSAAEVQNQNAALDEGTSNARSKFEDSNVETTDIMSSPNEVNLESYVMLNDKEARNNSMEENTSLQENNKNTSLDSINDLNEPNSSQLRGNLNLARDSKNQLSNTTQQVDEANMVKDSELSETLDERPLEQQTTVDMSQSNVYVANNKSLPCSSAAEVQNQNAALDEGTSNATSNFEDSNVETTDIMSSPNEVNLESYVMLNDKEARNNSMEENTSLQENNKNTSLDSINDLNEPNSSQLRGNLNLAHYGTASKNQLSNTTQQVDEANMVKDSELSKTLDERPLEQQTTVDMSQSNVNVANNKSLPCSSAAEVQNQNAALDEGTSNARSKFGDSNVDTNDIISCPNETHLESQVTAKDKKARSNSVKENISLQENNKQTVLDYSNENNEPNLEQYGTDSETLLSNTTQHHHILEANTMKEPEQSEKLVKRPLEQKTTVKICQSNANVDNNSTIENGVEKPNSAGEPKFSPSKLDGSAIVIENEQKCEVNINLTKEKKIVITCSQRKEEKNNEVNIENNDSLKVALSSIDIKITISGTKNLSITAEEANSHNVVLDKATQTSVEEEETNEIEIFKKAQGSQDPTITEQSIGSSSPTEKIHSKKILTKMTHDETSAEHTMNSSRTNNESIIKGELDKSHGKIRAKESMSSVSPKEKTITNDGVTDKGEDQICIELTKTLTITTEKPNPEKVDQTDAEETKSLLATETKKNDQYQIITPAGLTVSLESYTQATNTIGESSSSENKTVASTTEETYTKDVASENVVTSEETDTKQVLTEKPHVGSTAEKTISSASANNETYIKVTLDETQAHQANAELTVISGTQTEVTNANDETSGEDKTLASTTEETYTKDVAIENAKDLTSNAKPKDSVKTTKESYTNEVGFGQSHSHTNAEETEHSEVTAEGTDTKQVLREKPQVESTTVKTMNSASANNKTNIDEAQDHQTRADLTVSSNSQTEASNTSDETSSEENQTVTSITEKKYTKDVAKKCSSSTEKTDFLENGQKSQNQTIVDKTNSIEKTTKETGVKNHLQKTQDLNTVEKSKQYEKNVTDAKDETFPKTAATTSKMGQQANRGRGRGNNNKKRNNKNTRKGN